MGLRLPKDTLDALRTVAEREDRSVNYVIRRAIDDHLEHLEEKETPHDGQRVRPSAA